MLMTEFDRIFIFLVFAAAIPATVWVCIEKPKLVPLFFITVLFVFSDSTWGQLKVESNIYSRGVGMFNFSLLEILLLTAGFACLIRKLANPQNVRLPAPMSHYFVALLILLVMHILVGTHFRIDVFTILSNNGIINVLNMMIFMYMVIMAFNREKDENRILRAVILLAAVRAVFGLVRYFAFGGDTANPYQNFEGLDTKLVYFDIADNFVACLAAFWAAWLLTADHVRLSFFKRLGLYAFLAVEVAVVALSFRRSSLIGLALMFIFLLFRISSKQRLKLICLGLCIMTVSAVVLFQQRLQYSSTGNFLTTLIYDMTPDRASSNRFYEWAAAMKSVGDNWLVGLGTWGTFTGDADILSYHTEKNFNFIHSGFGHLVLKSGVIGLLLFLAVIGSYARTYFRHWKTLTGNARLLLDIGFAGFIFWIPTLVIGTPIIEYRTMLMIGLALALPFVAINLKTDSLVTNNRFLNRHATA